MEKRFLYNKVIKKVHTLLSSATLSMICFKDAGCLMLRRASITATPFFCARRLSIDCFVFDTEVFIVNSYRNLNNRQKDF